jgi:hypothetical protein
MTPPLKVTSIDSPASDRAYPERIYNNPSSTVFDPWAEVFASWRRVIEGAPVENKPKLLAMMAADAALWADAHRQQAVDDVRAVATELGFVTKFGEVTVQDAIATGFAGGGT